MAVLDAIQALKFHQDWAREHRVDGGPAFTHFSQELIKVMAADLSESLIALEACTDAEFETASQVFEDVARVHGLPFVEQAEKFALQHSTVDVSEDLSWARDAAEEV